MSMNVSPAKIDRLTDDTKSESQLAPSTIKSDSAFWNKLVSEDKTGNPQSGHSNPSDSTRSSSNLDGSSVSLGILKAISNNGLNGEIKFSLSLPGRQNIDVSIVDNKNFISVNLFTSDRDLRKKMRGSKKEMESSISSELNKKVVISVK